MTTATVLVRLVLSFCAFQLTEYPCRRAIAKIRSLVVDLTMGLSLNARETVAFETFASRARSSIVVRSTFRAGIAILATRPQRPVHIIANSKQPVALFPQVRH